MTGRVTSADAVESGQYVVTSGGQAWGKGTQGEKPQLG